MIDAMGELIKVGIPGYRLLERYDMLKCAVSSNAGLEKAEQEMQRFKEILEGMWS